MNVRFIGFDQWQGKFDIGSSRIRCDWPIKYWPEAKRFKTGERPDVMIYQKAYWIDHMKAFNGIKILDICDPDWLDMNSRVIETIQYVDGITTSSQALADDLKKMVDVPVICIPDRVDLEVHQDRKKHFGTAQSVVWFGYSHNFEVLYQCLGTIEKLKLDLIVISNNAFIPPPAFRGKIDVINHKWQLDTVNKDIITGDIVLNPKLNIGRFKYKSDNKTITSWALGMPVATNDRELKNLLSQEAREQESAKRLKEVEEKYDVRLSVQEYKDFIEILKK